MIILKSLKAKTNQVNSYLSKLRALGVEVEIKKIQRSVVYWAIKPDYETDNKHQGQRVVAIEHADEIFQCLMFFKFLRMKYKY